MTSWWTCSFIFIKLSGFCLECSIMVHDLGGAFVGLHFMSNSFCVETTVVQGSGHLHTYSRESLPLFVRQNTSPAP